MKSLVQEKAQAIRLRQKGYTYKEILAVVPVAKSSLSMWLKGLPLTREEKSALKLRTNGQINRGRIKVAGIMRSRRLVREKEQLQMAREIFVQHSQDPLFHSGVALYWAEGGKRTNQWQFMNSDHAMLRVMIVWLVKYTGTAECDIRFRLYVHKAYQTDDVISWWSNKLLIKQEQFLKTIVKPSGLGVKKRLNYRGCLRIEVRSSKSLLNQMRFWQKMIVEYYMKQ